MTTVRTKVLRSPKTGDIATSGSVQFRAPYDQVAPDGTQIYKGLTTEPIALVAGKLPDTDIPPGDYEVKVKVENVTRRMKGSGETWFPITVSGSTVDVIDIIAAFTEWSAPVSIVDKAVAQVKSAILAGVDPAYDTLLEIAAKLGANDTVVGQILTTLGEKLNQTQVDARVRSVGDGVYLTQTAASNAYAPLAQAVPTGGTTGQVLTKSSGGYAWATPSGGGSAPSRLPGESIEFVGTGAPSGDIAGAIAGDTYRDLNTNTIYDISGSASATGPGAPTGLTLTAGDGQIGATWTAPTSNGGSAITDYVVQTSTDQSTWTTFADGTSTATSTTITGQANGTQKYVRVAAVNAVGQGAYVSAGPVTPTAPSQSAGYGVTPYGTGAYGQ